MTDTCEKNLIPAALTYDDVRAVSPALYPGSANAFSLLPVVKDVLEKRKLYGGDSYEELVAG